jgi:hypothetical protein
MSPVRESDGDAEHVIDIRRAGGILESRPEAEAVVVKLSIADAKHDVIPGPDRLGYGGVESHLQPDISRLRERLSAKGRQCA